MIKCDLKNYSASPLSEVLFICLVISLLFLPKIPLFYISGQDVRAEDILSLFFLVSFYLNNNIKNAFFQDIVGFRLLSFLAFSIFSSLFNIAFLDGNIFSILFILRWTQYFLIGYVFFRMAERNRKNLSHILLAFLIVVGSIAILDIAAERSLRYRAWFSGPWELGTISILCAIFICSKRSVISSATAIISCAFVVLAGEARIQIVAFATTLLMIYVIPKFGRLFTIGLFSALVVGLLLTNVEYFDRLYGALSRQNIAETFSVITANEREDFRSLASKYGYLDASLMERMFIWKGFVAIWLNSMPFAPLIGIGLGTGGVVIDGLYIRLFFEGGVIGFFLFYRFVRALFDQVGFMGLSVFVSLAIISVTNDPITSMRITTILFLVLGGIMSRDP